VIDPTAIDLAKFDLGSADALLICDDSESNPDLRWASRFVAPDAFSYVATSERSYLLVGDLELDRARDQSRVDEVLSSSHYGRLYEKRHPEADETHPERALQSLVAALEDLGLQQLAVPAAFPLRTAELLRDAGFEVTSRRDPLFPGRAFKSADEVAAIRAAQGASETAMAAAAEALRRADGRDDLLILDGEPLTSERLRRIIHRVLLDADCIGEHTIVAGGEQGCDPHNTGSGPLRPGQTIIIDIFPRHEATGYFGDITRTFVKGAIPEAVQHLWEAVRQAQAKALEQIRAGTSGRDIHARVEAVFVERGYETGLVNGHMQGFFHGTGHGVGLAIHEAPSIGKAGTALEAGHLVTVEPGLYYPGVGGVRLEDLVVVTETGCDNLTTFPLDMGV